MPFLNIILEPDGSVGFCRHKGTNHRLGNIKEQNWSEIWNGPAVKQWRKEFLEGKPVICAQELNERGCNLCPELAKLTPDNRDYYQETLDHPPLRFTANLNGQCNLKCQICDVWELPNGYYTEENFWAPARKEVFPFIKEMDLLSGEPLIQTDTFKLIDEVSKVNPECKWTITTNAHWSLNQKRKDYLDQITIKNLILSVDSLNPEVFSKVRSPGNLATVLKTIDDLIDYEQNRIERKLSALSMNLNFVVQKDNWTEVAQVIHFCLDKNIHPFVSFCYLPREYSLLSFNLDQRIKILQYYIETLTWGELTLTRRVTMPLLHSLPKLERYEALSALEKKKIKYENTKIKK